MLNFVGTRVVLRCTYSLRGRVGDRSANASGLMHAFRARSSVVLVQHSAFRAPELHRPNSGLGVPSPELHRPSSALGIPSPELRHSSSELGVTSPELHRPSSDLGVPSPELRRPCSALGVSSPELRRPSSTPKRVQVQVPTSASGIKSLCPLAEARSLPEIERILQAQHSGQLSKRMSQAAHDQTSRGARAGSSWVG